jgi:hypothetical protein
LQNKHSTDAVAAVGLANIKKVPRAKFVSKPKDLKIKYEI